MYNNPFVLAVVKVVFQELLNVKPSVPFSKYFDVSGGYAFKSSQYSDKGFFVLRVTNIDSDGSINKDDAKYIPETTLDENLKKFKLSNNDILMVMVGGSIGKVGIVKSDILPALLNQNLWKIDTLNNASHKYIFYLCLYLKEYAAAKASSTHGHFSRTEFRELIIPDLNKSETKFISDFIDSIILNYHVPENNLLKDKIKELRKIVLISTVEKKIVEEQTSQQTHLQHLRQTILQEAVQGKLTKQNKDDEPAAKLLQRIKAEKQKLISAGKLKKEKELPPITEGEIPFDLPRGWVWCRLGEAVLKITDGFHNTPPRVKEGYPYVLATQIKSDGIDFENGFFVSEKYHKELWTKAFPQKGEILLVNIGAGCGTPAIINVDFEFSFKNSAIIKQPKEINSDYLFFYFLSIREKVYNEIIQGGAQPYLSLKMINNLLLPLPPLSEQQRIVTKVQQLLKMVKELEQQVAHSQTQAGQLLQAVLKEAFNKPPIPVLSISSYITPRKILAAWIIQLFNSKPNFGVTMFQKNLHICEYHAQVEYETDFSQRRAGPDDREFMKSFQQEMAERKWFQQEHTFKLMKFISDENVGELTKQYPDYFRDKGRKISFVLELLKEKNLDETELISTLYAVWNNRIIKKQTIKPELLVKDVFDWSEEKNKYTPQEIKAMFTWMNKNKLIPVGWGKPIEK